MFFDYQKAQRMKERYPSGTRIRLNSMEDPIRPHCAGYGRMVNFVDDIGTLHCTFDNGRTLGVVPGEDSFSVLSRPAPSELEESPTQQFGMRME